MNLLSALLPASRLASVEHALLHTFGNAQVTDIVQLKGGLSAALVYKIAMNDRHYLLKLTALTEEKEAAQNIEIMQVAANAGIAPLLYYANAKDAVSISTFIEHTDNKQSFSSSTALLDALAVKIRSIHALPLFAKAISIRNYLNGLLTQFKGLQLFSENVTGECFNYYKQLEKYYPWADTDVVSGHNDLNRANVLFEGEKIWIIDWDAAAQTDRYIDLAIAAQSFSRDEIEDQIFLKAYFGNRYDQYKQERFFLMQQVCLLVHSLSFFMLAFKTKPVGLNYDVSMQVHSIEDIRKQIGLGIISLTTHAGQLQYGKALFNKALSNMRSARFAHSLSIVAMGA